MVDTRTTHERVPCERCGAPIGTRCFEHRGNLPLPVEIPEPHPERVEADER